MTPEIEAIKKLYVVLVDKNDNELGLMEKMQTHINGLLHRAVSVFIFNTKGEWLLQKRASDKYHSAGLWSNTCCTHPYPDEPCEKAAYRRLYEEMGLVGDIKQAFKFEYYEPLEGDLYENEIDHVFIGITNLEPQINIDEVEEWKYIATDELLKDLTENPHNYTAWFKIAVEKVLKYISLEYPHINNN